LPLPLANRHADPYNRVCGTGLMTSPLQGRSIFLVEDEGLVALDICNAFEAAGAQVTMAVTLSEALELVESQHWAGAVLDYSLSGEQCSPLCARLLERKIPFIIYSGYEKLEGVCALGHHVEKPAPSQDLVGDMISLISAR
jgi:CheY-like chemotaxis protein